MLRADLDRSSPPAGLRRRLPGGLRRFAARVALAALAPAALAAAAQGTVDEWLTADWTVERLAWHGELAAGATVSVVNVHGDLRLRLGQGRTVEVAAAIQRRAGDPDRPDLQVREEDGALRIEMSFPASGGPAAADYAALAPRRRADLVVHLPAGAPLVARTVAGLLEAKGVESDVEVESDSGDVVVSTTGTVTARSARGAVAVTLRGTGWSWPPALQTVTGDVRLELPEGAEAEVTAVTSGEITTDYSLTITSAASEGPPGRPPDPLRKRAVARVGGGGTPVRIESEKGNIKILKSPP